MPLTTFHTLLGRAFSIFTLIVALWALLLVIRRREIGSDFWGALIIGEGMIVLQGLLGLFRLLQGAIPGRGIHFLYGVTCLLAWPAVFAFTRGQTGRRETIIWAVASACLFVLTLRATLTGLS